MGEQAENAADANRATLVMRSNYEGPPALILAELANRMEVRGSGTLIGISSVAGLRGRATNYVYGSAKAGFTAFLSGLRNRLAKKGVHVLTVLPGFVNTAMTSGDGSARETHRRAGRSRPSDCESRQIWPECDLCAPDLAGDYDDYPRDPRADLQKKLNL